MPDPTDCSSRASNQCTDVIILVYTIISLHLDYQVAQKILEIQKLALWWGQFLANQNIGRHCVPRHEKDSNVQNIRLCYRCNPSCLHARILPGDLNNKVESSIIVSQEHQSSSKILFYIKSPLTIRFCTHFLHILLLPIVLVSS